MRKCSKRRDRPNGAIKQLIIAARNVDNQIDQFYYYFLFSVYSRLAVSREPWPRGQRAQQRQERGNSLPPVQFDCKSARPAKSGAKDESPMSVLSF